MALEDEKLEALWRWGQGLRDAGGEEYAAAGRAILMLIEEIESLRLELARRRERSIRDETATDEVDGKTNESLASTFRGRLPETSSPESWIESLRGQD